MTTWWPRMRSLLWMLALLASAALFAGCAFGYNRVLFVTKTNVGLEATSTPPTLQLDIARTEGVIAPQFQGGRKLPVMASFRFSNDGFFAPAVGSAFSTGDAALTMAALYADSTPKPSDWEGRIGLLKEPDAPTDSAVTLSTEPELPRVLGLFPLTFQKSDVRPVFFGTDTSLGIKVAWSGATAEFPDSARFGYNRTELALVPISLEKTRANGQDVVKLRMASLIATLDAGVSRTGAGGRPGLDFGLVQYFATGQAATLLALQQDVRKAMLTRLDPYKEERKREFEELSREGKVVAVSLLPRLYNALSDESATNPEARALVTRLDAVVPVGIGRMTTLDFKPYDYQAPALTDTAPASLPPSGLPKFVAYRAALERAARHLETALGDQRLATLNGTAITAAQRQMLTQELENLKVKLAEVDKRVGETRAGFRDAFEYFYQ